MREDTATKKKNQLTKGAKGRNGSFDYCTKEKGAPYRVRKPAEKAYEAYIRQKRVVRRNAL